MLFNIYAVLVAALSSFVVGFIWYHPKVFGTIWMKEIGMTEEKAKQGNMLKIFGLTAIYAFLLAFIMPTLVIHDMGALAMVGGPTEALSALPSYANFMADYGGKFNTFTHGALHGFFSGLFIAVPIVCINGLFEHKSWKYMAIQSGYWIAIMTVMGTIICGWT